MAAVDTPRTPAALQHLWRHLTRYHLLWLAALYVLLSGLVLGLLLLALRAEALRSGERALTANTRVIEEMTRRTLQMADLRLELAAHAITHPQDSNATDGLDALLQRHLGSMRFARALWVADARGAVRGATADLPAALRPAGSDYFLTLRDAAPGRMAIGTPIAATADGAGLLVPVAHPLHDVSGRFLGVVAAGLDPAYFAASWATVDLGRDAMVALLRRDGVQMMGGAPGRMEPSAALQPVLQGQPQGHYRSAAATDGIVRTFAYRSLQSYPELVLAVGQADATLLAPWRTMAAVVALAWALTAAAVVGLGLVMHQARVRQAAAAQHALALGARLDMATSATSIGVWEWDMRTDQAYGSPSYYTMLGYPARPGVIDRQFWFERCHPDDVARAEAHIQRALAGPVDSYQYEVRLRHADGNYRWVRLSGRVTERDAQGHAMRLMGVRIDIHQQVLAEEALHRSQALNLAVLNSVQAHIAVLDRHGTVVALNEPWRQHSLVNRYLASKGRPPVAVGDNYLDICRQLPPELDDGGHRLPVAQSIRNVLERRSLAFNATYPSGSAREQRWIALQVTPLHSEDGGVVISHTDITERLAATERLHQMMRLYALRTRINRAIIDQRLPADLLQAICSVAVAHGQFGLAWIVQTDPATGRMRPLASSEAAQRLLAEMTDPGDGCLAADQVPVPSPDPGVLAMADIAGSQATWPLWAAELQRAGMRSCAVLRIAWDGRPDLCLHLCAREPGFFTPAERQVLGDIAMDVSMALAALGSESARERAELALHALLRDKEALLKEVHHRVKNNLQVVSSLLRLEAARDANTATVSVLRDMQGRIQAMALLHEALYGSGNFAAVDLASYLRQLATQAFATFSARSSPVRLDLALASVQVSMDQAITCGLLVNELVSNSLKHAFPAGRTGQLQIGLRPLDGGEQWRLRVADDGIGLPPDLAQRQTRSLGLQLATDLADQLGGPLQRGDGPGADFHVDFRIEAAP